MKLTVLGSGVLIPVPERGNSGYFLETSNHSILIDGGSGTLRKMADFGLNYRQIDTICYTHLHPDHAFDLVPLLFAYKHDTKLQRPKKVTIIAPRGFGEYFDKLMNIYGHWVLDDDVEISIHEVYRNTIPLHNLAIDCNRTTHTDCSVAYRFVDGRGRSLSYSGDTGMCDGIVENAKDTHVLLLECSFPDDLKREGHLTPSECGQIAAKADCGRLILTHFYPEVLEVDIVSSVNRFYHGKVDLAYDGMEIEI